MQYTQYMMLSKNHMLISLSNKVGNTEKQHSVITFTKR